MNFVDLLTGGEPIDVDTDVDARVSFDNSVYLGFALLFAMIILTIIIFFFINHYL